MDAFVIIGGTNVLIHGVYNTFFPISGIPLAGIYFYTLLIFDKIYFNEFDSNFLKTFLQLTVLTDALQYISHRLAHKFWRKSHNLHHIHKTPKKEYAFDTGIIDAFLQLLLPITITIWIVCPSRNNLIAFGTFYSLWLRYIHTNKTTTTPMSWLIINPAYHTIHHKQSCKNFGHIFTIWDRIGGTFMSS